MTEGTDMNRFLAAFCTAADRLQDVFALVAIAIFLLAVAFGGAGISDLVIAGRLGQ